MKRFGCLLLLIFTVLSLFSCGEEDPLEALDRDGLAEYAAAAFGEEVELVSVYDPKPGKRGEIMLTYLLTERNCYTTAVKKTVHVLNEQTAPFGAYVTSVTLDYEWVIADYYEIERGRIAEKYGLDLTVIESGETMIELKNGADLPAVAGYAAELDALYAFREADPALFDPIDSGMMIFEEIGVKARGVRFSTSEEGRMTEETFLSLLTASYRAELERRGLTDPALG